ncbi:MAG: Hsp20/alpha crystallin family protein [Arenicellales bacterium]
MFGTSTSLNADQFNHFRRLERELDELLGRWRQPGAGIRSVARDTFPPINVGVTADRVDVYVFAPGLDPKQINVTVENNLLSISGERRIEVPEQGTFYRRERHDGPFRRVVTLPEDTDPDKISASYRDGILQVTVQRRESARPRRVEVE